MNSEKFEESNQNTNEQINEWESLAEVEFLTADSDRKEEFKNDPSMLVYLTSADHGVAIKKKDAVQAFMEKVKNAKNADDFSKAHHLDMSIEHSKQTEGFSEEELEAIKKFKESPIYREKYNQSEIERSRKQLLGANDVLERSEAELAEARKGGFLKRFFKRFVIKTKQDRVNWTKQRIEELERTIAKAEEGLAQAQSELEYSDDEYYDIDQAA